MSHYGLTPAEWKLLKSLQRPDRIQRFLDDDVAYNLEPDGPTCFSPRQALRRMTGENPDILVGAGTVLTPMQAAEAVDAGAKFIVAPGFGPSIVDWCLDCGVPVFPGVCTPTEVEMALARGLTTLKFFPAEPAGGIAYLEAIAAPYGMVEFLPTGGINASNIGPYLAFRKVVACGGSWMAPAKWIAGKQFDRIRDETRAAVAAVTGGVR